jgi:DNA-binding SARP family transcriptional activator
MSAVSKKAASLLRAASTVLAIAVVVLFIPAVLVIVAGVPVPRPFDAHMVLAVRGALDLCALVAWAAWAFYMVDLVRATRAVLRGTSPTGVAPVIGFLGTRLAAACMVIGSLWGGAALATGTAGALNARPVSATQQASGPAAPTSPAPAAATGAAPATTASVSAAPGPTTVTVVSGDSLWLLAEQCYGAGADWQVLASANLGRVMDDGTRFTTPNLIYPGWELIVPALESAPAPVPPAAPSPPAAAPVAPDGPPAPSVSPLAGAPVGPHTIASAHSAAHKAGGDRSGAKDARAGAPHRGDPQGPLPELALLGIGALSAAVLARRIRRSRMWARTARRPGQVVPPLSESGEEASENLMPFVESPAPDLLTGALSHLLYAIRAEGIAAPRIRLVRVGPDGVALVLSEKTEDAPGAFHLDADGMAWVLDASLDVASLEGAGDGEVFLPALLPVGDDREGSYLVPVEPGEAFSVVGPRSADVLATIRTVAEAWEWSECQLTVTSDPLVAAAEAAVVEGAVTVERFRVLFCGHPADLDVVTRGKAGAVCNDAGATSDVVAICEEGATVLEPFGLRLTPSGFSPEIQAAVEEVMVSAETGPIDPPPDVEAARGDTEVVTVGFPEAGPREARVLVPLPRIDGEMGESPATGVPRMVELFCYLVLQGVPVPSHELMMEALASKDGDAAYSTLRNVARRLRAWVGADYVPSAQRTGYHVSSEVTSDLGRLQEAVRLATRTDDEGERVALLRPALELIEGRPVSRTTSGWGWWSSYEAQASAAASDAAQMLAPILAARGDAEGARWAIDRARRVDDYSEDLYRMAMRCAGLCGDPAWARRELRACEAKMEELTPGSSPSDATYEVYRSVTSVPGVSA